MARLPISPREHELARESEIVVRSIIGPKWLVSREEHDYGIDLRVEIVSPTSIVQNGEEKRVGSVTGAFFTIQLKGTDDLQLNKAKTFISHSCYVSALYYYLHRTEPVVYLVFDGVSKVAYWTFVQDYLHSLKDLSWMNNETHAVRVPFENVFDASALKQMRDAALKRNIEHRLSNLAANVNNPYFSVEYKRTQEGGTLAIKRRPGDGVTSPFPVKSGFSFDNTSEGQEAYAALQNFLKTGTPARIDGRYVSKFNISEILPEVFAHFGGYSIDSVEFSPFGSSDVNAVSVSFLNNEGKELAVIPFVDFRLVQGGTEEVTYSNHVQDLPLFFIYKYNFSHEKLNIQIDARFLGKSFAQIRRTMALLQKTQDATQLKLTELTEGSSLIIPIAEHMNIPALDQLFEFLDDMLFIEQKVGQTIFWNGDMGNGNSRQAHIIKQALITGSFIEHRKELSLSVDVKYVRYLLASIGDTRSTFPLVTKSMYMIFSIAGVRFKVGPCERRISRARLSAKSVRKLRRIGKLPDDAPVELVVDILEQPIEYNLLPEGGVSIISS